MTPSPHDDTGPADAVLVAPYGPAGASTRVRGLDWFDHVGLRPELKTYLGTQDTTPSTLLRRPASVVRAEGRIRLWARGRGRGPLLLLRNATPLSNGGVERRLLRSSTHGVYDFDDALMVQQPGLAASVFSRARVWRRAVQAADTVIAGNDYLADAASDLASDVVVVPTCVEPTVYRIKTDYAVGDPPRAVWVGSPSTEVYLRGIAPALLAEHRRSGMRVTVISAGAASLDGLEIMTDRVEWREDIAESTLADADLGLMPLSDGPWERGKCAYKLLQYGAAGLPAVGSPVGANRPVLEMLDGLASTGLDEWSDALAMLVSESAERRQARGRAAAVAVIEHFSFGRWAETWRRAVLGEGSS
jgi:glycosyltransferase involved in cell wall biosynthesis